MSVDLSTTYLGFELKNPLAVAACSLTDKLDNLPRLEEAGVSAVVLHSLFQEQIEQQEAEIQRVYERGTESFAEALTYFPEPEDYGVGPDRYLKHIEEVKKAVSIPVIASLNGSSTGGWVHYAKLMQEAGADALELNIYFVAADVEKSGQQVEAQYVEVVAAVRESISIPLSVKVGPYFSSPGHMALRLVEAGADGLVLFNRFLQPNIDLKNLKILPRLVVSSEHELLVPLRWIAILRDRTNASLALTSGIQTAKELLKAILVGADVGMVASVLYRKGVDQVGTILREMREWMEAEGYESVRVLRGSMSQAKCSDPVAFERGNYMKALTSYTGKMI